MAPYPKIEIHMNSVFRISARNPDPVTSQEATVSVRAKVKGCDRQIIEVLRQHGPLTQKEIAAATGIAEISCSPLLQSMR